MAVKRRNQIKIARTANRSGRRDDFQEINEYLLSDTLIPIIGDTVRNEHIFDVDFDRIAGVDVEETADANEGADGEVQLSEEIGVQDEDVDTDVDLNITEWLAAEWAEVVGYPLRDRYQIARVAQYHRVDVGAFTSKKEYIQFQKEVLLQLGEAIARAEQDEETLALINEQRKRIIRDAFPDIVKELEFPRFEGKEDPLRMLAKLPISIYITTGYYDFIERALKSEGKNPRTRLCLWDRNLTAESLAPEHRHQDDDRDADAKNPIVFHLFGLEQYPASLVLSEDDYLDFLSHLARDGAGDTGDRPIPTYLGAALSTRSLLMLGYRLHDWDFRVLFRGILNAEGVSAERRQPSLAIQLDQQSSGDDVRIREYLDKYFKEGNFRVILKNTDDFIAELWEKWQPFATGDENDG